MNVKSCFIIIHFIRTQFISTETRLYCTEKEVLVEYMFIMNVRLKWNGEGYCCPVNVAFS